MIKAAMDRALEDARHNPETARALFDFAVFARSDAAILTSVQATMTELGVSAAFLSHKQNEAGSTELSLHDG